MKVNSHCQTEEYLDILFSHGLLPIITKPTCITSYTATLIDHIYTNSSHIVPGMATVDISDHLPIFCIVKSNPERVKLRSYYRDFSNFNNETFILDINQLDWSLLLNPSKSLLVMKIDAIHFVVNKHAPIKLASYAKQKQLNKPWITKGILKSIKLKQKVHRTHFLSYDLNRITSYKKCSNTDIVVKRKLYG